MKKLNSAQEAIKQAIEGGYDEKNATINHPFSNREAIVEGMVLHDPLFWQALGKARGWEKEIAFSPFEPTIPYWLYEAKAWFGTCMLNGDENKFWQSLP
jgi:hypothetical protein